jgi:hypothetical protein
MSTSATAVDISGFGNLTIGEASKGSDFSGSGAPLYADFDDDWSFEASRLGIQVSHNFESADWLTITAQAITRGTNFPDSRITWLNAKAKLNDNFDVTVGRFAAPFYFYSASIDVGYAYNWITPPDDTYRVDIRSLDGLKLSYNTRLAGGFLRISAFSGSGSQDIIDAERISGVNVSYNYDWLTVRYHRSDWKFDWLRNGRVTVEDADRTYNALGLQIDKENFTFLGEYILQDSLSPRNQQIDLNSYYMNFGYRLGQFLPHFTFSNFDRDIEGNVVDRDTFIYGLRWDSDFGYALKLEYTTRDAGVPSSANVEVLSASVDFVF